MSVSSGGEWELISNALIKDQDEAADFLARPLAPGEEISMDLQAKMTDLQDTISRLVKLDIKGKEEDQSHPADREIQSEVISTPMDVDVMHRADLGVSPAESGGYPEAEQVPLALRAEGSGTAPAGFVRPMTHAPTHQPVRWCLDPENHAFSKLVAFPDSSPACQIIWSTCCNLARNKNWLTCFRSSCTCPSLRRSSEGFLKHTYR